jgi:solute:Na+ symporter, SSS family
LSFGAVSLTVIGRGLGGFQTAAERILSDPGLAWLLSRERVSAEYFFSYLFIPLSAIAFPHITIFCLTARRMQQFKGTVILYPICILAIWLPCVYLGVLANGVEQIPPGTRDDVLLLLLRQYAPEWLAGILGAGIMAAVMASDSQILALSTMFTEDVFAYYGHKERFGERAQVFTGRLFIILVTTAAYLLALRAPASIFELASQYAFAGFAALSTLFVAALFWRRSTKWGALAVTIWVALSSGGIAVFQNIVTRPGPVLMMNGVEVISRSPAGMLIFGYLPVVPMTLISAVLMVVVSLVTTPPKPEIVERYFPSTTPTRRLLRQR